MAHAPYFPPGVDASTADVLVKCVASNTQLPAHRAWLEKLSPQLAAAIVGIDISADAAAASLVAELTGDDHESDAQELPNLTIQSTSEESVRLLLAHAYELEVSARFCFKTAAEVAVVAKKYDISVLFRKADAFLAKSMDDRTTDRLRCKPTFWAAHGHIVTESALRFTAFADRVELTLMLKAAENLVAHIVVLEQAFDASKHALAGQLGQATWDRIRQRVAALSVIADQSTAGSTSSSTASSPRSSLGGSPRPGSPVGSPRSVASFESVASSVQVSGAFQAHLAQSQAAGFSLRQARPSRKSTPPRRRAPSGQPAVCPRHAAQLHRAQAQMFAPPVVYGPPMATWPACYGQAAGCWPAAPILRPHQLLLPSHACGYSM